MLNRSGCIGAEDDGDRVQNHILGGNRSQQSSDDKKNYLSVKNAGCFHSEIPVICDQSSSGMCLNAILTQTKRRTL